MFQKVKDTVNLIRNMGWRYVAFRSKHEFLARSGLLKSRFPVNPAPERLPSLKEWQGLNVCFFFSDKESIRLPKNPNVDLERRYLDARSGKYLFFNSIYFDLGKNYDWLSNPDSGFVYDSQKHWTEIADYAKDAGDIKYVWEKSRFSFIYDIIRYDYHFDKDCSTEVFQEILSWIDHNPINCGPNYRCSQEISLRVLNWIFALYYYKNSSAITDGIFAKIMHNIYWQVRHVSSNINFSRIAVRNNHAITETMGLYLFGILLPFFPEADGWKKNGKKWFQEEVAYQIYPDGTFLQFSMNYHRVVIQLLTWGIRLAELNGEMLNSIVRERATASLAFMLNCIDVKTGQVPNYGANDGALFFRLNDHEFSDFRPQLHALSAVLATGTIEGDFEDRYWYGITTLNEKSLTLQKGMLSYPIGGFYLLRERDAFSFIRCGSHKDRPSQADNLHLDLWINGHNILRDGGSYKYNTDDDSLRYFFGTASHNTVKVGDHDQMKKGGRFIWFYWTQSIAADWEEKKDYFEFKGIIRAFQQINPGIVHKRTLRKYKSAWKWEVIDEVDHDTSFPIHQLWHPADLRGIQVHLTAYDGNGKRLEEKREKAWHSSGYGLRESTEMLIFSSETKQIKTIIEATTCS